MYCFRRKQVWIVLWEHHNLDQELSNCSMSRDQQTRWLDSQPVQRSDYKLTSSWGERCWADSCHNAEEDECKLSYCTDLSYYVSQAGLCQCRAVTSCVCACVYVCVCERHTPFLIHIVVDKWC